MQHLFALTVNTFVLSHLNASVGSYLACKLVHPEMDDETPWMTNQADNLPNLVFAEMIGKAGRPIK